MPLLIGYDLGGLDPKTRQALDHIVASIQTWAAQVDGINTLERLSEISAGLSGLSTVEPGTIVPYGGPALPSGYLRCDGAAVSRETYAALFAAIGTTWGVGNGSTTFNVPDLRGKYFFCQSVAGTGSTLGSSFGTLDHTHTGPSHTHNASGHTHTITGTTGSDGAHAHGIDNDGSHTHSGTTDTPDEPRSVAAGGDHDVSADVHVHDFTTSSGGTHDHGGTTDPVGGHTHSAGTLTASSGGSGTTDAAGTGATGSANPAAAVMQAIIKT